MNLGQTIGELRLRILQLEDENEAALRAQKAPRAAPRTEPAADEPAAARPRRKRKAQIGPTEQIILDALKIIGAPVSTNDIHAAIGGPDQSLGSIKVAAGKMHDKGLLVRSEKRPYVYSLPAAA